jgi:pyrophosphate--fructose-6-phosphate 1-phosphotransferase
MSEVPDPTEAGSPPKVVALLTAGGLAPCLSAAVAYLIELYTERSPTTRIICYKSGYKGLLLGDWIEVTPKIREGIQKLHAVGGSPIGNSRVKLTNVADCIKRGLVKEGQNPQHVAAEQLVKDGVEVLHTIGGDDTSIAAAKLADYLEQNKYKLCVIGLPKTIDNDVVPIRQSLGAMTAAEQGGRFFANVVAESTANPRMFIVHEVMGRDCGWLTAATAASYQKFIATHEVLPEMFVDLKRLGVHAIYLPEMEIDIAKESERLKAVMDEIDCVNIFISEGAGVQDVVRELESSGVEVPKDAFGHYKLDAVNVGKYFAEQFAKRIGAEKTLVQKSGYFARAAPANEADRKLIRSFCVAAVDNAFKRLPGIIGEDEDADGEMRAIEFHRIKGGKRFDLNTPWFVKLCEEIGQPIMRATVRETE